MVWIWDHNFSGAAGYFPDHAYTPNLDNYAMDYGGDTWNNEISSFYTSTPLFVYEDTYYGGDYAIFSPGFHDLESFDAHGIENNDIGSFYAAPPV